MAKPACPFPTLWEKYQMHPLSARHHDSLINDLKRKFAVQISTWWWEDVCPRIKCATRWYCTFSVFQQLIKFLIKKLFKWFTLCSSYFYFRFAVVVAKPIPEKDDCQRACFLNLAPVCGTDGKTYPNLCQMEYTACTYVISLSYCFVFLYKKQTGKYSRRKTI